MKAWLNLADFGSFWLFADLERVRSTDQSCQVAFKRDLDTVRPEAAEVGYRYRLKIGAERRFSEKI